MKLSPTQQKVMTELRGQFVEAISCPTFEEYYATYRSGYSRYPTAQELKENWPGNYDLEVEHYRKARQGIFLTKASGPTIHKLENLGLIRILEDTTGTGSYQFDEVQLIV